MSDEWSWAQAMDNATLRVRESVGARSLSHVRAWQNIRVECLDCRMDHDVGINYQGRADD